MFSRKDYQMTFRSLAISAVLLTFAPANLAAQTTGAGGEEAAELHRQSAGCIAPGGPLQ